MTQRIPILRGAPRLAAAAIVATVVAAGAPIGPGTARASGAENAMRTAALAPAARVELREAVTVEGQYVHLGDLFAHAGEKAGAKVAYAPRPGRQAVFDANWLYRVARAYGLPWRPISLQQRAIVEREALVVERAEIEAVLTDMLADQGAGPDTRAAISNRSLRIHIATDKTPDIGIEDLYYEPTTRRFSAVVAVPANDVTAQRVRVSGRAYEVVEVPVPTRRISQGDVVREGDIKWIEARGQRLGRNVVTDLDDLVGMAARRSLRAGAPVRTGDVQPPILVARKSLVTMVLQTPAMTMTAKGVAVEDGARGEVIRVTNVQSRTPVEAVVTGANTVRVTVAERPAIN